MMENCEEWFIEFTPDDDPCVLHPRSSNPVNPKRKECTRKIECAGRAFNQYFKFKEFAHEMDESEENTEPLEEEKDETLLRGKWAQKRKEMSKEEFAEQSLFKDDFYEILGLESLGVNATDTDIKSAYRKLATIYHPDKVLNEGEGSPNTKVKAEEPKVVDKEIWMKIQKAYDVLSSPQSRKQYDSSLPFDDTVPKDSDEINDDNFFAM